MGILVGNVKSKTSWIATVLAVFGILYDNWSQVAQLIPPQYVGKAFTAIGLIMLVLRNVTSESTSTKGVPPVGATPDVSKSSGFARIGVLATLFAACTTLVACATFQSNQATFHLAVDVAVLKFIDNSAPDKRQSRITHVRQVAAAVKGLTAGDSTVTLTALQQAVGTQIDKLGLTATDLVLARDLVQALTDELNARVGQNLLTAEQRVQVAQVMDWIIQDMDSLPTS